MKQTFLLFTAFLCLSALMLQSCEDDSLVDKDKLTREITDLVPADILDEIVKLGMAINGGTNPPNMQGTYFSTPFVLKNSNISTDNLGSRFPDYYVTLFDQINSELTIKYSYVNGPESGEGLGGFIVGEQNKFTVFVEVIASAYGEEVSMLHVISGKLLDDGIEDLYFANFMLDNYGNPNGYWIENGKGRIAYDQDGFSPKTHKKKLTTNKPGASMR